MGDMHNETAADRLGYALGSGSAKGFAHIGVLKVLEARGLRPDVIAGSSIGAIVGALYAAGMCASAIEDLALSLDFRDVVSITDLAPLASTNGDKVIAYLVRHLPSAFAELDVPFACVSSDLYTGECVTHDSGDLVGAIRASIAVPGFLTPVERDHQLLADGGLTEPVPVQLARDMGAEAVIAVSLSCLHSRNVLLPSVLKKRPSLRDRLRMPGPRASQAWTGIEVMQRRISQAALRDADVVIEPDVRDYSQTSFLEAAALIELGEQAAEGAIIDLERLHVLPPKTITRQ